MCLNDNNIYKIGKSIVKEKTCNIPRLISYRQGSELISVNLCINANIIENLIIKKFREQFKIAYGNEYFIGNKFQMMKIIHEVLEAEEKNDHDDNIPYELADEL